jgi:hypothetical protein
MQRVSKVDPTGELMTVDLMMVDRNLEAAWASRQRLPFGQEQVVVISRDALMAMKALAARPQDLADIQNMQDVDR